MKYSIRTFLLANLLVGIIVIVCLTIVAQLFFNHKKIQNNFATQFVLSALTVQNFLEDTEESLFNLPNIPSSLYLATAKGQKKLPLIKTNNKINLLASSLPSPTSLLNTATFSTPNAHNTLLHIFTTPNNMGFNIAVAENYDYRYELEHQIAVQLTWIMLISLPFLGILILIITNRSLRSIKQVTKEVKNRAPDNLKPVNSTNVPLEIQPLVTELNKLFVKLHEALLREERFASDAAHELRTPLAALRAHVHVALKATSEEERNRSLQKISDGLERSTHVVNQLLLLSRVTKPRIETQKTEPVSLTKEAQTIIADLFPQARKKKIDIELVPPKSKDPMVMANATAIGILLRNLIDNSIRYVQEAGLIKVIIQKTKDRIILKVIDNGPGITKKDRTLAFNRFVRFSDSGVPGSGLGLNIVQQIAKQYHAELKLATPKSGKGLEVDVIFKLSR